MPGAANIAADIVAVESDAAVASTAAQVAVLAAESAVQMAAVETAVVASIAADKIESAESAIEENKDDLTWLRNQVQAQAQTLATMETKLLSTLEMVATQQAQILELTALRESPSSALPAETPTPEIPLSEPQSAEGADQQEALEKAAREKKRHQLL